MVSLLVFEAFLPAFSQHKMDQLPKFTLEGGPAISVPGNSFIYSGSVMGIGLGVMLNDNISSRWTAHVYAGYHIFLGILKSGPAPLYKPRMLSLMPGVAYYFSPIFFIGYNMGITGLGGEDERALKAGFSYNPAIGISFPAHSRRIALSLGYMHVVDSPDPSACITAGMMIRIF